MIEGRPSSDTPVQEIVSISTQSSQKLDLAIIEYLNTMIKKVIKMWQVLSAGCERGYNKRIANAFVLPVGNSALHLRVIFLMTDSISL